MPASFCEPYRVLLYGRFVWRVVRETTEYFPQVRGMRDVFAPETQLMDHILHRATACVQVRLNAEHAYARLRPSSCSHKQPQAAASSRRTRQPGSEGSLRHHAAVQSCLGHHTTRDAPLLSPAGRIFGRPVARLAARSSLTAVDGLPAASARISLGPSRVAQRSMLASPSSCQSHVQTVCNPLSNLPAHATC